MSGENLELEKQSRRKIRQTLIFVGHSQIHMYVYACNYLRLSIFCYTVRSHLIIHRTIGLTDYYRTILDGLTDYQAIGLGLGLRLGV